MKSFSYSISGLTRISKAFKTLKTAEAYQWRLYGRFDSVKLVESPGFTEAGTYVWHVKGAAIKLALLLVLALAVSSCASPEPQVSELQRHILWLQTYNQTLEQGRLAQ